MRSLVVVGLCLVILGVHGSVCAQQRSGVESSQLVDEVAGLRASVEELVRMLDRYMSYQQTELLLRRIDLKQRRLAPLEREVRSRRDQADNRREELAQFDEMERQVREQIQDEIRSGVDSPESETRRWEEELELRRKMAEERLEELEQTILETEGDMLALQRELLALEDLLADLLDE